MKCLDCGREVQPRNAWTEVTGFDRPRAAGGTNHVAERKPTGRVICNGCLTLRQSGIAKGQGQLGG